MRRAIKSARPEDKDGKKWGERERMDEEGILGGGSGRGTESEKKGNNDSYSAHTPQTPPKYTPTTNAN